jgi:hypothetical protein
MVIGIRLGNLVTMHQDISTLMRAKGQSITVTMDEINNLFRVVDTGIIKDDNTSWRRIWVR